jgi:hypothetical protein
MVSQTSNSKPRIEADATAFPELEPCLDLPAEYGKSFTDGIDFYTWQFVNEKDGRRSGIGFISAFFQVFHHNAFRHYKSTESFFQNK